MPIYVFKCDNGHKIEKFKHKPYKRQRRFRCDKCGLYLYRDYPAEHSKTPDINLSYTNDPISHLVNQRSFRGIMVEALTPEPVMVRDKRQYDKLLRDTRSAEKDSGYGR